MCTFLTPFIQEKKGQKSRRIGLTSGLEWDGEGEGLVTATQMVRIKKTKTTQHTRGAEHHHHQTPALQGEVKICMIHTNQNPNDAKEK